MSLILLLLRIIPSRILVVPVPMMRGELLHSEKAVVVIVAEVELTELTVEWSLLVETARRRALP